MKPKVDHGEVAMRSVVIPLEITAISHKILSVIRWLFCPDETALTLLTVRPAFKITPVIVADPMRDVSTPLIVLEFETWSDGH